MLNIEKYCYKVTNYISTELRLPDEEKEVINYGLFALLQMIYSFVLVFIIGYIFKVHKEATIIVLVISLLRKTSGGVHASTPMSCLVLSTTISIFSAVILKLSKFSIEHTSVITIIIFIYAYYIVYSKAPVDSINKPINSIKKRERLKKSSIKILSYYLVIILIVGIYFKDKGYIYIMSINAGVLCQIFSLTRGGDKVFKIMDKFINFVGGLL